MPAVLVPEGLVAPVALGIVVLVDLLLSFFAVLGAVLGMGGVGSMSLSGEADENARSFPLLSGVPDFFDRNKILSGYDLSHYQVPHCIRVFFYFV